MLEIKISLVHIKKMLASVSQTLCYESHFTQGAIYIIPWFTCLIQCLIYIHMTDTCLKLILLCFIFTIRKTYQMLWKIFLIPSLFMKKTCLLTNMRNKFVIRKKNIYFLTSWKMAKFFLQKIVIFNMITDSILVEKWRILECARRCVCKNLLSLGCQNCFRFSISQVA